MNRSRMLPLAGALLTFVVSQTHAAPERRYRVDELVPPASIKADCLPGFAAGGGAVALNDFGIVQASFSCYTTVDPDTSTYLQKTHPWVGAAWFSSIPLPITGPQCCTWGQSINNFGQIFGAENMDTGGFAGMIWTVSGRRERVFDLEACDQIRFSAAVGGNGRHTLGWALRGDPAQPPVRLGQALQLVVIHAPPPTGPPRRPPAARDTCRLFCLSPTR